MFQNTWKVIFQAPKRFASTKRKYRKVIQLLGQDTNKFPVYDFPKPKPTDRRLYVWGFAGTGALGNQQVVKKARKPFTRIIHHPSRQSFAERRYVLDVGSGYGFSLYACKLENDKHSLFGSGLNTDSQIGFHKLGGITNKPFECLIYPAPIILPTVHPDEKIQIKSVSAGRAHSVALSEDGIIYTLGNNAYGQCGRPVIEDEKYSASQMIHRIDGKHIEEGEEIVNTVCGQDHSLFLSKNGKVYSCGWGADGQTGLGHYNSADTVARVRGDILNEKIVKVASSADFVLALNGELNILRWFASIMKSSKMLAIISDKGEVFGWGNSEYKQLDLPDDQQQVHTPMYIKSVKKCGKIVDIAAGGSFCLVLNGEIFTSILFFLFGYTNFFVSHTHMQKMVMFSFGAMEYLALDHLLIMRRNQQSYHQLSLDAMNSIQIVV